EAQPFGPQPWRVLALVPLERLPGREVVADLVGVGRGVEGDDLGAGGPAGQHLGDVALAQPGQPRRRQPGVREGDRNRVGDLAHRRGPSRPGKPPPPDDRPAPAGRGGPAFGKGISRIGRWPSPNRRPGAPVAGRGRYLLQTFIGAVARVSVPYAL